MREYHLCWLGLLTGLLAACHGRGGSAAIVRDSAGARIVESTGPLWRRGQQWTIDERPLLDIGGNSADPHYDLLQITDAVRLGDGRIVVMNDGVPATTIPRAVTSVPRAAPATARENSAGSRPSSSAGATASISTIPSSGG